MNSNWAGSLKNSKKITRGKLEGSKPPIGCNDGEGTNQENINRGWERRKKKINIERGKKRNN